MGLIGLLSPLLWAGLWSWGTYKPSGKGKSGPIQMPSERVQEAVLCTAWWAGRDQSSPQIICYTAKIHAISNQDFIDSSRDLNNLLGTWSRVNPIRYWHIYVEPAGLVLGLTPISSMFGWNNGILVLWGGWLLIRFSKLVNILFIIINEPVLRVIYHMKKTIGDSNMNVT